MMSLEQIRQVNGAREQPPKVEKLVVDLLPKVKARRIPPVTRMTYHARLRSWQAAYWTNRPRRED